MLTIIVPIKEAFNEATNEFVVVDGFVLDLEHSLVSLSKWESEFEKPFLGSTEKTVEETLAYIKFMVLTPNVPDEVYAKLDHENLKAVNDYINADHTATWFSDKKESTPSRETITSELIYYWLVALTIPWECQHWHLNRLLTLVRICNVKNAPQKKVNKREMIDRRRALNAERKAKLNTSG